jgi:hypothetical protein
MRERISRIIIGNVGPLGGDYKGGRDFGYQGN